MFSIIASVRLVSEYGRNVHPNCENNLYDFSSKEAVTVWKKEKVSSFTMPHVFKSLRIGPRGNELFVDLSDHNLMFSLDVDGFQQFNNSPYLCGAMYLTFLNLPRSIRSLRENMIFVGLMPGGNGEASLDQINHNLKLLVDELLTLADGIMVKAPSTSGGGFIDLLVKGACTLFVCDLPAASKACGFSSFNSTFACRRCDHAFDRFNDTNQPKFHLVLDINNIRKRTNGSNRRYARAYKSLTSHASRQLHVRSHGTRYSEFHRLPYVDLVTFTVFDPMHNVWIGTCKRVVHNIFLKRNLLSKQDLEGMAALCKKITLPIGYDSASIASKINNSRNGGFSYMKADEWRVFTIALSPLLLKGRIHPDYYNNWMIFVECMQVMSLPGISRQEVEQCHLKIEQFLAGFIDNYGGVTPRNPFVYHFISFLLFIFYIFLTFMNFLFFI